LQVDSAAYLEDWNLLTVEAMQKAYPLSDGSGHAMLPALFICDSGGKAGLTERAYDYYRKIKCTRLHQRLILINGGPSHLFNRVPQHKRLARSLFG
jgi:hypothetical protein